VIYYKNKNYKQKEKNSSENVERKSIQNNDTNQSNENNREKKGIYKNLDTTENNEFQNEFMKSLNFYNNYHKKGVIKQWKQIDHLLILICQII